MARVPSSEARFNDYIRVTGLANLTVIRKSLTRLCTPGITKSRNEHTFFVDVFAQFPESLEANRSTRPSQLSHLTSFITSLFGDMWQMQMSLERSKNMVRTALVWIY